MVNYLSSLHASAYIGLEYAEQGGDEMQLCIPCTKCTFFESAQILSIRGSSLFPLYFVSFSSRDNSRQAIIFLDAINIE